MKRTSLILGFAVASLGAIAFAGPIDPPAGPVAPSNKTLQEVYDKAAAAAEPRTPINATTTPGDATSLFRITNAGSYYLTGNITGVSGKHGIAVAAGTSNVSIDLNGFSLIGVAGSLDGINAGNNTIGITVRNGNVRSWGGSGLEIASSSASAVRVSGVTSSFNTARGIGIGGGIVTDCNANNNGTGGIYSGLQSTISNCTVANNTGDGIFAFSGAVITACDSNSNSGNGVLGTFGALISNCNVRSNGLDGILVSSGATVVSNACSSNGLSTTTGARIHAGGNQTRIEGNNCGAADYGIRVDGTGVIIIRNTCSGNTTANYSIVANNRYGPIIDITATGTAAVTGNSAASNLGSTDPNANFAY
jgi:hypothetical protein